MGSEWTESTVGSLCKNVTSGGTPRSSNESYYTDGTIPWLNTKEVNFQRIYRTEKNITQAGLDNSAAKWIPENSVIVAMYGATAGKVATNDIPLTTNQACCNLIIDDEKADHRFVYYHLSANTNTLLELANGAAQQNLNAGTIKDFPIPRPPLPEQKAIAHILGTLDDKIELNRRMNATLEGMAQALFKSWFVDFDPVIDNALAAGNPIPDELAPRAEVRKNALANGTTQKGSVDHSTLSDPKSLFPAAFQLTEELSWIPEGWTLQSFESLATLDTESVKPFEQPATVWEHYSIPSYDSAGMPSWDRGDEIKSNKYRVKPGAILSSKLNPETERTWWPFMVDEEAAICSTEFMQFVPKNLSEQAFVYSLIRSAPFQSNILERVTGSTGSRQRAQPKEIAKIGVLGSGESLRAEFVKVALPLFQSIRNNSLRNQTLTKLRDTLLPKLISGDLGLPEAEQLTEEALT